MSINRSRESGTKPDPDPVPGVGASVARLATLGANLQAHRFEIDLTAKGLVVRNPNAQGCCPENPHPSDTVTCRAREEDGGRTWFMTSWGEPIAPVDRVADAVSWIKGNLANHPQDPTPRTQEASH